MNIVVCIKQVPDTTEVKLDPKTGTLIREGIPSIMNPDDRQHEAALTIRIISTRQFIITMGLRRQRLYCVKHWQWRRQGVFAHRQGFQRADTLAASCIGRSDKKN